MHPNLIEKWQGPVGSIAENRYFYSNFVFSFIYNMLKYYEQQDIGVVATKYLVLDWSISEIKLFQFREYTYTWFYMRTCQRIKQNYTPQENI